MTNVPGTSRLALIAHLACLLCVRDFATAQEWQVSRAPAGAWVSVASSADGARMVAANLWDLNAAVGSIFTSTDAGKTWIQTTAPSNSWVSVCSSADGIRLVAAAGLIRPIVEYGVPPSGWPGLIYTSMDSGATWTQTTALSNAWSAVACSADGTRIVAATYCSGQPDNLGSIFTSTNSGATWVSNSAPLLPWSTVASSANGTVLAASGGSVGCYWDCFGTSIPIYISTNSGLT